MRSFVKEELHGGSEHSEIIVISRNILYTDRIFMAVISLKYLYVDFVALKEAKMLIKYLSLLLTRTKSLDFFNIDDYH